MNLTAHIEQEIRLRKKELSVLVTNGYALTHTEVVNKSMELDQLILCAISTPSKG